MKFIKFPKKLILTSFFAGLFYCFLTANAYCSDWQYWQGETVNKKINDTLNLGISYESRYQNSGKEYFTELITINPMFKLSKNFSTGPIYYYIPTKQKDGSFKDENRSGLLTSYKWAVGNLKLEYRLLYEYRDLPQGSENRVRHRFQVIPDINLSKNFVSPYFSYEMFYSFTSNDFMQTRACLGDTVTVYQDLKLSIQYLVRQDKVKNNWCDINTFGTYLKYSF
ncbi:MAG: DUF2490 domain-containing protein [Elusimicrobia bacterium]|nr:DUF2490 domain-containing protein [Candidatus Liberimonas magnetica]